MWEVVPYSPGEKSSMMPGVLFEVATDKDAQKIRQFLCVDIRIIPRSKSTHPSEK